MSTDAWKHEMRIMLEVFHRQATISLQKILSCLDEERSLYTESDEIQKFRDIFLRMSNNTLTFAFIEVENKHRYRRPIDRKRILPQSSTPLNQSENVAQNRVTMDNSIAPNAANMKMEIVPSAVNLATLSADVIVIDSSDDEADDTYDVPATPNIAANKDVVEAIYTNERGESSSSDPTRDGNGQPVNGSTHDGIEGESIAMDSVSLCSTENASHGTGDAEQNGISEAATVSDRPVIDLSDPDMNNGLENTLSTSSKETEMPSSANSQVAIENQEPPGPVPMKRCRLCPFVSRFRSNLKMHMQGHAGQRKPYKCHICSKCFASLEDVEKHLKLQRHRNRFYCSGCSRGFPFAKQILAHEASCKKSRVYECFMCHFTVLSLSTLEIHMRKHTGDKPYKCGECPKRYAYLTDLQQHSKVHVEPNGI